MNKKIFRLIILIFCITIICLSYNNLSAKELTNKAALALQQKGIMQGDNGDLMLDQPVKREEMMVLISRLLNQEDNAKSYPTNELTFKDVDENNWAAPYIAWAFDEGITEGYSETSFGYGDYVTYEQGLAFLIRILGYEVSDEMWMEYNGVNNKAFELGLMRNYLKTQGEYYDAETYVNAYQHTFDKLPRDILAIYTYDALATNTSNDQKLGVKLGVSTKQEVDNVLTSYNKSNMEQIKFTMRAIKERLIYLYISANNYPSIDEINSYINILCGPSNMGITVSVERINEYTYKIIDTTFGVTEDDVPSILLDLNNSISDYDVEKFRKEYIDNAQLAQWQTMYRARELKNELGRNPEVSEIIDGIGEETYNKIKINIIKLNDGVYKVVNTNPDFSVKEIPDYTFSIKD